MTDPPSLLTLHRQAYNLVELASTGFHHYASFFFFARKCFHFSGLSWTWNCWVSSSGSEMFSRYTQILPLAGLLLGMQDGHCPLMSIGMSPGLLDFCFSKVAIKQVRMELLFKRSTCALGSLFLIAEYCCLKVARLLSSHSAGRTSMLYDASISKGVLFTLSG
jgi:hypothetical protein